MLIFNPTELLSDAAAMGFSPSGNVKVMNNEFVKMKNEQIHITLYEDECKYRVDYTFVNDADEQSVVMGFPNYMLSSDHSVSYGINDFSAFDGNSIYKVFRKYNESQREHDMQELYECFEVHFNKGETKYITNTYSQEYTTHYGDGGKAIYILTTGASWKGTIDTISVFIDSGIPFSQMVNRTVFFHSFYEEDGEMKINTRTENRGLRISPDNYVIEQNVIKMVFTDIEPDFDIEIFKPDPPLINKISASSELEDKNDRYSVWNIVDERPETAWATTTGKKTFGINEFITIDITPYSETGNEYWKKGLYKIQKIGIINGYAKNIDIFKQNNRIKELVLECENGLTRPQFLRYTLEDTIAMQYIEFDKPIFMNKLKLQILEVYKGSKYDDTCISEVKIFPVKE
jgi:hypothetical protein